MCVSSLSRNRRKLHHVLTVVSFRCSEGLWYTVTHPFMMSWRALTLHWSLLILATPLISKSYCNYFHSNLCRLLLFHQNSTKILQRRSCFKILVLYLLLKSLSRYFTMSALVVTVVAWYSEFITTETTKTKSTLKNQKNPDCFTKRGELRL